jgi:hypothetical protein
MSTTDTTFDGPVPQSFPPPPPAPKPRSGGSVAAIVIGALVAFSGFLTAISGVAMLAIFGGGHALTSGDHVVSTPRSAIVADLGHIDNIRGFELLTGSPTLQLSAQDIDGSGVFVGVGHTEDVERYLDGVATDRIADLDFAPFQLTTVPHEGSATAGAPAEQGFWVASAQSTSEAELNWLIDDGSYEVVVMNADGSAGVLTTASVGTSLPTSTGLWIVVTSIGGLILIGGTALIIAGARRAAKR